MLPDFPAIKAKRRRFLDDMLKAMVRKLSPILAQIKDIHYHEGNIGLVSDVQGNREPMTFEPWTSIPLTVSTKDMVLMNDSEFFRRMIPVARDIAEKQTKKLFEEVNAACKRSGNIVNAPDLPLAEQLLQMVERVQIDFDAGGTPTMPSFVCNPSKQAELEQALSEIESNPAYRQRYEEAIKAQREQWHDREVNRQLVD